MSRYVLLFCILLVAACRRDISVMSYNVANLFDDRRDGTEYPEYDPAEGEWTSDLYRRKCDAVAGAIKRAVPGGADIVALQEIEHHGVLETLRERYLRGMGYRFCVTASGPPTATRVGLLSRFPVVRARSHLPCSTADSPSPRAVLEVECTVGGRTLYLFNNHWKSKTGGTRQTERDRIEAARTVARRIRAIAARDPMADILVLGDLNENHDEYLGEKGRWQTALLPAGSEYLGCEPSCSLFLSGIAEDTGVRGNEICLFEPWMEGDGGASPGDFSDSPEPVSARNYGAAGRSRALRGPPGSYVWEERWQTLDHILLSRGLFHPTGVRYLAGSFTAVALPFLLESETGYPKGADRRGDDLFSDHLPLLLRLEICDASLPREGNSLTAQRQAPRSGR